MTIELANKLLKLIDTEKLDKYLIFNRSALGYSGLGKEGLTPVELDELTKWFVSELVKKA